MLPDLDHLSGQDVLITGERRWRLYVDPLRNYSRTGRSYILRFELDYDSAHIANGWTTSLPHDSGFNDKVPIYNIHSFYGTHRQRELLSVAIDALLELRYEEASYLAFQAINSAHGIFLDLVEMTLMPAMDNVPSIG